MAFVSILVLSVLNSSQNIADVATWEGEVLEVSTLEGSSVEL